MFKKFLKKRKLAKQKALYFHIRVEYPRFQEFIDDAVKEHAITAPGCTLSVHLNLHQTEAFVKVMSQDGSWGTPYTDITIKQYNPKTLPEIAPTIKDTEQWSCCVDCHENNRKIHGRAEFDPLKPRGGLPPIEEQKGIFNVV